MEDRIIGWRCKKVLNRNSVSDRQSHCGKLLVWNILFMWEWNLGTYHKTLCQHKISFGSSLETWNFLRLEFIWINQKRFNWAWLIQPCNSCWYLLVKVAIIIETMVLTSTRQDSCLNVHPPSGWLPTIKHPASCSNYRFSD